MKHLTPGSWAMLLLCNALAAQEPLAFASGSWFDPGRNGEGFVVQVLPDARAVVTWFTYPPDGEEATQAWLIGTGAVAGNRIEITEMLRPFGARFGPGFDPGDVVREPWGSLTLTFEDCATGRAEWAGPPAWGDGSMALVRLSSIDDVACEPGTPAAANRVISGRSGPWYDPDHDGEGWMLETLADGRLVLYWFTFDDLGRQAWLIGQGELRGSTALVESLLMPVGARFGDDFDPADVQLSDWGRLGFAFEDCLLAVMSYASTDPRFGSGKLVPVRLARLASTSCSEPPPEQPLSGGSWRLAANMPLAVSESASATLNGRVYTAGGYGNLRGLQRYDPATDTHRDLPDLPADRHHPMAASDGRHLYVAGGFVNRLSEVGGSNFWRFDPETSNWAILADMPSRRAAGAAVHLAGRIWIVGGVSGSNATLAYDIESGLWSSHPAAPGALADHMQAVAFENEIWWIGGRSPQAGNAVRIWNPVREDWREGPSLLSARAGFSAKVVQGQIMVSGGELISVFPGQVVRSLEIFAPGAADWVTGPGLLIAVHGSSGASARGEYLILGGSEVAGTTGSNTAVQIYSPARP